MSIDLYTANERWYLALTSLWAARLRAEGAAATAAIAAEADVGFAVRAMGLQPGMRVLDLACAWGRTTLELARRGYDVTGFDLSWELIEIARLRAAAAGLPVPLVQGTVRRLPDLGLFDAVTAFYDDSVLSFEDEADNLAALRGVARALRPGGRFLFGTTDCPLIIEPFQRHERYEGDLRIVEEISFDAASLTGRSVRAHHHPDGRTAVYHRVRRHHSPAAVSPLLGAAGLRLRGAWCAYDEVLPYGSRAEGMVLLAATEG